MAATRTRTHRIEQGLTQRELAARAGVNWRTVLNVEKAHHEPDLGTLRRLATALGVPVEDLLDPHEEPV